MSLTHHIDEKTLDYFSHSTVNFIQDRLKQKFFEYYGTPYMTPKESIIPVMHNIYLNQYRQIHEMTNLVINIVFSHYKNEMDHHETTVTLDQALVNTWDPSLCIRQHPPIKLRNRGYSRGWFSMNY